MREMQGQNELPVARIIQACEKSNRGVLLDYCLMTFALVMKATCSYKQRQYFVEEGEGSSGKVVLQTLLNVHEKKH